MSFQYLIDHALDRFGVCDIDCDGKDLSQIRELRCSFAGRGFIDVCDRDAEAIFQKSRHDRLPNASCPSRDECSLQEKPLNLCSWRSLLFGN